MKPPVRLFHNRAEILVHVNGVAEWREAYWHDDKDTLYGTDYIRHFPYAELRPILAPGEELILTEKGEMSIIRHV